MPVELPGNDVPNGSASDRIQLDEAALESLFKTHFTILCAYCQAKYSFDLDSAKESVHTSFIKLWENRHSISNEASVKAYLYKIVNNTCLDLIKHNKVKQRHENYVMQNAEYATIYDLGITDVKLLKETIDKAVSGLPHQMRRIFVLSRYEGLKYSQIASLLNVSVKTVETQMSRSLLKLRQKLARYIVIFCLLAML